MPATGEGGLLPLGADLDFVFGPARFIFPAEMGGQAADGGELKKIGDRNLTFQLGLQSQVKRGQEQGIAAQVEEIIVCSHRLATQTRLP